MNELLPHTRHDLIHAMSSMQIIQHSFEPYSKCFWFLFDGTTYLKYPHPLLPSVDVRFSWYFSPDVSLLASTVLVEGTRTLRNSQQSRFLRLLFKSSSKYPYWRNGRKENTNKMVMDKKKIQLTMDARNLN